jgi:hypothetical protein
MKVKVPSNERENRLCRSSVNQTNRADVQARVQGASTHHAASKSKNKLLFLLPVRVNTPRPTGPLPGPPAGGLAAGASGGPGPACQALRPPSRAPMHYSAACTIRQHKLRRCESESRRLPWSVVMAGPRPSETGHGPGHGIRFLDSDGTPPSPSRADVPRPGRHIVAIGPSRPVPLSAPPSTQPSLITTLAGPARGARSGSAGSRPAAGRLPLSESEPWPPRRRSIAPAAGPPSLGVSWLPGRVRARSGAPGPRGP